MAAAMAGPGAEGGGAYLVHAGKRSQVPRGGWMPLRWAQPPSYSEDSSRQSADPPAPLPLTRLRASCSCWFSALRLPPRKFVIESDSHATRHTERRKAHTQETRSASTCGSPVLCMRMPPQKCLHTGRQNTCVDMQFYVDIQGYILDAVNQCLDEERPTASAAAAAVTTMVIIAAFAASRNFVLAPSVA